VCPQTEVTSAKCHVWNMVLGFLPLTVVCAFLCSSRQAWLGLAGWRALCGSQKPFALVQVASSRSLLLKPDCELLRHASAAAAAPEHSVLAGRAHQGGRF
jgi:hypothetical protein